MNIVELAKQAAQLVDEYQSKRAGMTDDEGNPNRGYTLTDLDELEYDYAMDGWPLLEELAAFGRRVK